MEESIFRSGKNQLGVLFGLQNNSFEKQEFHRLSRSFLINELRSMKKKPGCLGCIGDESYPIIWVF